ncbi:MAG: hypothetical protein JO166_06980 [Deltaproteobacteria bacterium]|nr:hypothetical protein [Deltaproteobacteria bacterium]
MPARTRIYTLGALRFTGRQSSNIEHYGKATFEVLDFQPDEFIVDRDIVVVLGRERCLVRAITKAEITNFDSSPGGIQPE